MFAAASKQHLHVCVCRGACVFVSVAAQTKMYQVVQLFLLESSSFSLSSSCWYVHDVESHALKISANPSLKFDTGELSALASVTQNTPSTFLSPKSLNLNICKST